MRNWSEGLAQVQGVCEESSTILHVVVISRDTGDVRRAELSHASESREAARLQGDINPLLRAVVVRFIRCSGLCPWYLAMMGP